MSGVLDAIGQTPIVPLARLSPPGRTVYAKLEWHNPGGSVKDRPALYMLRTALEDGRLRPGGLVVEPTAGNTGIGLALVGRALGLEVVCVMPARFSPAKKALMEAYGATVVTTPAEGGMEAAIAKAREIAAAEGGFVPNQFTNPANVRAHYETTGPEFYRQLEGRIDAVVLGGGSMGTFTGVVRYLKERLPRLKAYLVQPEGSYLVGECGPHKVEGIGADSPETTALLDCALVDGVLKVTDREAHAMLHRLGREEGVLPGGSGAAAAVAALAVAEGLPEGARVATLFPDHAERYLVQGILGRFEEWKKH